MADYKWGYTQENGPKDWKDNVPAAKGKRQSPINIKPSEAVYSADLAKKPLKWTYDKHKAEKLINTRHSVQVVYNSEGSSLEGGPLSEKYKLAQFHLHWGSNNDRGSEHTVDGKEYASELHLVHWNSDKYANFGEAASKGDGLCVLGIFLQAGTDEHKGLNQLTDLLSKVKFGGDTHTLKDGMDPVVLLPGNTTEYWTYLGSLTTPPLYESVTWIVFKEPIEVSKKQMECLRELREHEKDETLENEFNGLIVDNFRPPEPLNDRTVQTTIPKK